MKAVNLEKAWEIALDYLGIDPEHDPLDIDLQASERAGYNVFRHDSDDDVYVCELGDRLEINDHGKSVNVWIVTEEQKVRTSTTIREWRNEEWDRGSKARDQHTLRYMMKHIIDGADHIENKPTPGHSDENLSRCIVATSDMVKNTKYIIHMTGFTVEDIVEIITEEVQK